MNWQYKIIQIIPGRTADIVKQLNTLGSDRWEAIHFTNTSVILKRPGLVRSEESAQPEWFDSMPEEMKNRVTRVKAQL
jgi:hypothetical protein